MGHSPVTKKAGTRKRKEASDEDVDDTQSLVASAYASAGLLFGEHWRLSEREAGSIARPLSRIIARNQGLAKSVSKWSDPAALVIAALVVTMPRILMTRLAAQAQQAAAAAYQASATFAEPQPRADFGPGTSEFAAAAAEATAGNGKVDPEVLARTVRRNQEAFD